MKNLETSQFTDVMLDVKVEVGKKVEPFSKVLKLKEGDIIVLDKLLEDYLSIYLNDQLFALGEMVIVNDKFGIRIVDLA